LSTKVQIVGLKWLFFDILLSQSTDFEVPESIFEFNSEFSSSLFKVDETVLVGVVILA
jgi:hypothetical protein